MSPRFREGAGALGGHAGLDPGRQRAGGLPGRVPMGGQLGSGHRQCAGGQIGPLGQGVGVAGVQPGPLTRQQARVGDLPKQRVAKLVAALPGSRQEQLLRH